jgi:hypothetical protein
LRKSVLAKAQGKTKIANERAFRTDPRKFAARLFNGTKLNGTPTFAKERAESYFSEIYRDEERSRAYVPLLDMKRPESPKFLFSIKPPSLRELRTIQ